MKIANKIIAIGDEIVVDKGRLGNDIGILKSVDGISCFGYFGTYESYKYGMKGFDQFVHTIAKKARE